MNQHRWTLPLAVALMAVMPLACRAEAALPESLWSVEHDGVTRASVKVPIVFPVSGKCSWSDTFLAPRGGGKRRHHGQDVMARKMTPILAVFDGRAYPRKSGAHNTLSLIGDDGWTAVYMHINNDTPGTDDGQGSDTCAFASGLKPGCRVRAGDVIAYVGDSGNAESTAPHLHFELYHGDPFAIVNPAPSLKAARRVSKPSKWLADPKDTQDEKNLIWASYGIFNFVVSHDDIFVEGEVLHVDAESGTLMMLASTITLRSGGRIALSPARKKAVCVSTDTRFYSAETVHAAPQFADIREGQRICAIGRNLGVGSVLPARHIVVSADTPTAPR